MQQKIAALWERHGMKVGTIATILAVALILNGCAAMQRNPNTTKRAVGGTIVGGGLGAGLGAAAGSMTGIGAKNGAAAGSIVGAVVGLGVGLITGHDVDEAERRDGDLEPRVGQLEGRMDRVEGTLVRQYLLTRADFGTGRSDLTPDGQEKVARTGDFIRNWGYGGRINVIGYTDPRGSSGQNEKLALDRANAVKTELLAAGVNPEQVTVSGSPNGYCKRHDWSCLAQDRKTEIVLVDLPVQQAQQ